MATMKKTSTKSSRTSRKLPPAKTPEARENQMIKLAVDLAEQQLRDGSATSQVITHYLKLGTKKEKLQQEILEHEKELLVAKTEMLKSQKRVEELYEDALLAMRKYSGNDVQRMEDEDIVD